MDLSFSMFPKGSKCRLYDLSFPKSMNGELCKIVGSYRTSEDRYPVYIYKTKETVLIRTVNLNPVHTKRANVSKQHSETHSETALPLRITQSRDEIARTLILRKRNLQRVNSAKLFAESMVRSDPQQNLYRKTELTADLQCILNGNCFYIKQFFTNQHNLKLFQYLQSDLEAERWWGFLDRDHLGKTKSNESLGGAVASKKSLSFNLIVAKLAAYFDVDVRATCVNLYRDGRHYVPFHHDNSDPKDEREWLTIGASFGFQRSLDFLHIGQVEYERKQHIQNRIGYHYQKWKQRFSIQQMNGDVFAFSSKMNRIFKHSVPRIYDKTCGPRFSVMVWGTKKPKQ